MLGRTFTEKEAQYPPAPVVVIGYDSWQRKFNGDPRIIGQTLRMSRMETPPTIIGVMPPGVRFLPSPVASQEPNYNVNASVDFWLPGCAEPAAAESAVLGGRRSAASWRDRRAGAGRAACASPRGKGRPTVTSTIRRRASSR